MPATARVDYAAKQANDACPQDHTFWRKNGLKAAAFLLTQEEYLGNLEFNPYQLGTFQVTPAEAGELAGLDFDPLPQKDVLAGQEAARPRLPLYSADEARL